MPAASSHVRNAATGQVGVPVATRRRRSGLPPPGRSWRAYGQLHPLVHEAEIGQGHRHCSDRRGADASPSSSRARPSKSIMLARRLTRDVRERLFTSSRSPRTDRQTAGAPRPLRAQSDHGAAWSPLGQPISVARGLDGVLVLSPLLFCKCLGGQFIRKRRDNRPAGVAAPYLKPCPVLGDDVCAHALSMARTKPRPKRGPSVNHSVPSKLTHYVGDSSRRPHQRPDNLGRRASPNIPTLWARLCGEHLVIGGKRRHPAITATGTTSDAIS
jgi:hypothetical protein